MKVLLGRPELKTNQENLPDRGELKVWNRGRLHAPGEKENVSVQVKETGSLVSKVTDGNSTPEGMTEPEGSTSSFEVVDLPPNVLNSGNGDDSKGSIDLPSSVEDPHSGKHQILPLMRTEITLDKSLS